MGTDQTVKSAGGLLFDDQGRVLLIQKADPAKLGLAKGHVEPGESSEQAAIREVREETGYQAEVVRYLDTVRRPSREGNGQVVDKEIAMYLMRQTGGSLGSDEEVPGWYELEAAIAAMEHRQEADFLRRYGANPQ